MAKIPNFTNTTPDEEKGLFINDPVLERIAMLCVLVAVVAGYAGAFFRGQTTIYTRADLYAASGISSAQVYESSRLTFYQGYHASCVVLEVTKGGMEQETASELCSALSDEAVEFDAFLRVTGISEPDQLDGP